MFTSVVMHAVIHDAEYGVMHGLNNVLRIWGLGGISNLSVWVSNYTASGQTQDHYQQQVIKQPPPKKRF